LFFINSNTTFVMQQAMSEIKASGNLQDNEKYGHLIIFEDADDGKMR